MKITKIEPAFVDDRGFICDLLTDENIQHAGLLKSKKGAVRGRHFHKEQQQYTFVLSGKIRVAVKNLLEENSKLETSDLGKMEMVFFPPYHYHSIEALEDSECLIFTTKNRLGTGYEDDTIRVSNIESFRLENNA
jgi:dTDP-4-dehydrorhamnose 3,5-epimerase-like enzyme